MEADGPTPEALEPDSALVAVPDEAVGELLDAGLARVIPTIRGPALDAVVTVGADSAALVTLLQAPDAIRAFAGWTVEWARRRRDTVVVSARRSGRRVELRVDGDVPIDAVAEFLSAAFRQSSGRGTER